MNYNKHLKTWQYNMGSTSYKKYEQISSCTGFTDIEMSISRKEYSEQPYRRTCFSEN